MVYVCVYVCVYMRCACVLYVWACKHFADNELPRNVRVSFSSGSLPATKTVYACVVFIHPCTLYFFGSLHVCSCCSTRTGRILCLAVGNARITCTFVRTLFTFWCVSYEDLRTWVYDMAKLMHGSTVIKCREMNVFLCPATRCLFHATAACACKQARYVCTHSHLTSYSAISMYILRLYVYICLQSRFLCVARALSLSFSENLFHPSQ